MPDDAPGPAASLDLVVDDQALAVLASIDDLRHDLPGSVHDARVAARKLRSTLVVFRPMFAASADPLIDDLRWFAGELGGARDSQVIRSRITTAVHGNDADAAAAQALLAALDETTGAEWDRARAALEDPRTRQLAARLEQARLRGITATGAPGEPLVARIGVSVGSLIRRAEKVVRTSADDERVHLLRKRVKRVRFALTSVRDSAYDAFGSGLGVGRLSRSLEMLQDLLGEYQDAVVTAEVLDRLGAQVPVVAGLANDLAHAQRTAAASVRSSLPDGIERVRRAADRMRRRTSGVHPDSE